MPSRIRIGNQTSCHVSPAGVPFEFALRHRFDAFEWFSDKKREGWCEDDVGSEERRRLRDLTAVEDIRCTVHAPIAATPLTPAGADLIRRSLDFARDVGARLVNIHLFFDRGAAAFARALVPLLSHAAGCGVLLVVENTPGDAPEHFNAVFDLLSDVPEAVDRAGMCFDMGHANLFGPTRNNYLAYLDRLGRHVPILHWHAHENWGDRDSHLTLFTGPARDNDAGVAGVIERLLRRGFSGNVVLEQWPQPPEQLVEARNRLRALIERVALAPE
jgi:sugar phosphate isomerase/epimerase